MSHVTQTIAVLDGSKRIIEDINTAAALERFGTQILPAQACCLFQKSKCNTKFDTYFVQSASAPLYEAKQHASAFFTSTNDNKL